MPTFHSIVWDFGVPEVSDLSMDLTFNTEPPSKPAANITCVYLQLYDFSMFVDMPEFQGRGIYSYNGLQTNVYDANQRKFRGKGCLFSRFETSEPRNVRLAEGGWHEFPTPQHIQAEGGRFVGVRNNISWGPGTYRVKLAPTEESESGIWYELTMANLENEQRVSCGSLFFPKLDGRRPLIPNKGSSWIEVLPHSFKLDHFPQWKVTFSNVAANEGTLPALSALANYADDQAPAKNSDISLAGPGVLEMQVGEGVVRATPKGTHLRLR